MQSAWREIVRGLLRSPEGKELVREFANALRQELAANVQGDEWVDQKSPQARATLGRNRFCEAVRRRQAANPDDPAVNRIGDRYLMTTAALAEELARVGKRPAVAKAEPADPETSGASRVLHLLNGSRH